MIKILLFFTLTFFSYSVADLLQCSDTTPDGVDNFNNLIVDFVRCLAKEKNRNIKWWDLEASQKYFDKNQQFKKYRTNITEDNIQYTNRKSKEGKTHTKNVESKNSDSTPMTVTLEYKDTINYTSTVSYTKTFEYGVNGEATIGYPMLHLGFKLGANTKTKKTSNKTMSETKSYDVKRIIQKEIPGNSKYTCKFQTKELWEEADWTADIKVAGFLAVKFNDGIFSMLKKTVLCRKKSVAKKERKCHVRFIKGKDNVFFYPITEVVGSDNDNFKVVKNTIVYKGEGKYKGPVDMDTTSDCKTQKA